MVEKVACDVIERPKMPRATWDALRAHVVRERQKKKEENQEVSYLVHCRSTEMPQLNDLGGCHLIHYCTLYVEFYKIVSKDQSDTVPNAKKLDEIYFTQVWL